MKQHAITAMVVLNGMFATAWAQEGARMVVPAPGQPGPPPFDFKVDMLSVEPFELGDPIDNAPYSAEIVSEVTHELPDGNRIERRTTGAVARDSHGRVRREHQLAAIGSIVPEGDARMLTISDPVAGFHYVLDPVRKIAMRSRPPRFHPKIEGLPDLVISGKRIGPEASLDIRGEPEWPDVQIEQLGTNEYEGVRAEGTKTVATLPAGAIGNARPIEIVSERWYSPELHVVVFSGRSDPRFGETTYRLTNITRTEPDASLFQVPADYKLEDMKPLHFEPRIDR